MTTSHIYFNSDSLQYMCGFSKIFWHRFMLDWQISYFTNILLSWNYNSCLIFCGHHYHDFSLRYNRSLCIMCFNILLHISATVFSSQPEEFLCLQSEHQLSSHVQCKAKWQLSDAVNRDMSHDIFCSHFFYQREDFLVPWIDVLNGVMIIVLTIGPKVCRFKSGRELYIFKGNKNL